MVKHDNFILPCCRRDILQENGSIKTDYCIDNTLYEFDQLVDYLLKLSKFGNNQNVVNLYWVNGFFHPNKLEKLATEEMERELSLFPMLRIVGDKCDVFGADNPGHDLLKLQKKLYEKLAEK